MERNIGTNTDAKGPSAPTADLQKGSPLAAIRQALETPEDERGFFETVAGAAKKSGCEFLFEIPAALFGKPNARAAAIRCFKQPAIGSFFILYDRKNGEIQILSGEEVSDEASRFVHSYAGVLQCLQESGMSRRIH